MQSQGINDLIREKRLYLISILLGVLVLAAVIGRRPDYVGWLLVGISLTWLSQHLRQLVEGAKSRDWPAVEGTVTDAKIWQYRSAKNGARISAPRLRFRYQVAGKVYHGGPVVWGKTGSLAEAAQAYPRGTAITVYYHPRHPEKSRLSAGNGAGDYWRTLLPLGLLLLGASLIALRFHS